MQWIHRDQHLESTDQAVCTVPIGPGCTCFADLSLDRELRLGSRERCPCEVWDPPESSWYSQHAHDWGMLNLGCFHGALISSVWGVEMGLWLASPKLKEE